MDELRAPMPTDDDCVAQEQASSQTPGLELLRAMWVETLADPDRQVEETIHELITCRVVSIRYSLLTQLLGKVVDPARDALSIQRGDATAADTTGRWDARSFCSANVVPWVNESGQVLGTSPDPYVNNPLRRSRLDGGQEPVRNSDLWAKLVAVLAEVQQRNAQDFTQSRLRACLTSLASLYRQLAVEFNVPQRISLEATARLAADYLSEQSGGERAQVISAALMRTIGERFGIFHKVTRAGINEADSAADSPGDILCFHEDILVLAVEVKDRTLEIHDIETAIGKARRTGVNEILFATTSLPSEEKQIDERAEREFALGINVYRLSIDVLLEVALSIAGEASRVRFLTLVGEELNDRVTQPAHKLAWQELLKNL